MQKGANCMLVEKLKKYKGSYSEKVTVMMKEMKKQLKIPVPDSFLEGAGLDSDSVKNVPSLFGSTFIIINVINGRIDKKNNIDFIVYNFNK